MRWSVTRPRDIGRSQAQEREDGCDRPRTIRVSTPRTASAALSQQCDVVSGHDLRACPEVATLRSGKKDLSFPWNPRPVSTASLCRMPYRHWSAVSHHDPLPQKIIGGDVAAAMQDARGPNRVIGNPEKKMDVPTMSPDAKACNQILASDIACRHLRDLLGLVSQLLNEAFRTLRVIQRDVVANVVQVALGQRRRFSPRLPLGERHPAQPTRWNRQTSDRRERFFRHR